MSIDKTNIKLHMIQFVITREKENTAVEEDRSSLDEFEEVLPEDSERQGDHE